MCGLTGYLLNEPKETHSRHILAMMRLQRHRGPDDQGAVAVNLSEGNFWELSVRQDENFPKPADLMFGFNRLSILDLSANGHQPMVSPSGEVILMMNGEIYNAFDLKPGLQQKGYVFKSETDTEVALNSYLEYGIEGMLERLNGMFAIAVCDLRRKRLFLARDRFGIKPLYVLAQPGRLAFSSEMKSFSALPGFRFSLDDANLHEFWLFRHLINRTLFKGVRNLEPGTYWEVDPEMNIVERLFFDVNGEGANEYAGGRAQQDLDRALQVAVGRQMMADVKLGCQLSGGVDSSLVTYYAAGELQKGQLETISIIPQAKGYSEEEYMDQVISQLQLDAHKYPLASDYYFDVIDRAAWHFEHPINHPNTIGIYQLSQNARQHVTVLLSGEGADEVLGGYERFVESARLALASRSFWSQIKKNRKSLPDFLPAHLSGSNRAILASVFTSVDAIRSVVPDFSLAEALRYRRLLWDQLQGDFFLRQRKYEIKTYLPDLLMRQDKMSMAHSIENRVPFLDNALVSLVLQFSEETLLRNADRKLEAKNLLKQIASQKFSPAFAYRPKKGFGIPLRAFMGSDVFRQRWEEEWLPGLKEMERFETGCLTHWLQNLGKASSDQVDMIWLAVSFQLWRDKYGIT